MKKDAFIPFQVQQTRLCTKCLDTNVALSYFDLHLIEAFRHKKKYGNSIYILSDVPFYDVK